MHRCHILSAWLSDRHCFSHIQQFSRYFHHSMTVSATMTWVYLIGFESHLTDLTAGANKKSEHEWLDCCLSGLCACSSGVFHCLFTVVGLMDNMCPYCPTELLCYHSEPLAACMKYYFLPFLQLLGIQIQWQTERMFVKLRRAYHGVWTYCAVWNRHKLHTELRDITFSMGCV